MPSNIELAELSSSHFSYPVSYAVITPQDSGLLPLCIVLMGGGGSRQSLVDCRPLFDKWWQEGSLAPMVFATPSAAMSYYVEDPEGERWESFLIEHFIPQLRRTLNISARTAITGISMGGRIARPSALTKASLSWRAPSSPDMNVMRSATAHCGCTAGSCGA